LFWRSAEVIDHLHGLQQEIERFRRGIGDLDLRVPACPQWRVRDLVHHLGSVHRLFRRVAAEGWMERPPPPKPDDRPDVEDDRVVAWAARQSDLLVRALSDLDPEAPRWNFSPGPQVGAFIPRRMHLETLVHRWDLEGASGEPGPIDDEVAADGVREYLEVYLPRSGRWPGARAVLHTVVTDGPTLELVLDRDTLPFLREIPEESADVVVSGAAAPLLLAWWGRTPLPALTDSGDASLVAEVRRFAYS
jgi:uncharacterized protein (TIGR03083 family)